MKKLLLSAASVAMSLSAMAMTWAMPGTYNNWSLENNLFTEENGVLTQTIPEFYGDFKIVPYETSQADWWSEAWGTNGETIENGVAYNMVKGAGNVVLAGDNVHLKNAKVTLTPDDINNPTTLTILIEAESAETADDEWFLVGDAPLEWNFQTCPKFEKGENGVWTLPYTGTISQTFKVVKNAAWSNGYSTKGEIALDTEYTLDGPADPIDNMKPAAGPWENPTFTLTVGDDVKLKVTTGTGAIENIEADNAPAVYYNLMGVRVENPENGLFICKRGNQVTKVIK